MLGRAPFDPRDILLWLCRLLVHQPNRGVFVAMPSLATIIYTYRVRRSLEGPTLSAGHPHHPAVARMATAVEAARQHQVS